MRKSIFEKGGAPILGTALCQLCKILNWWTEYITLSCQCQYCSPLWFPVVEYGGWARLVIVEGACGLPIEAWNRLPIGPRDWVLGCLDIPGRRGV